MDELSFKLTPPGLTQSQQTKCIFEVCNLSNDPIFDLRLSLRAKDSRLLVIRGLRLAFEKVGVMESARKEVVLQGQATGEVELLVEKISGKHKRHQKDFQAGAIRLDVAQKHEPVHPPSQPERQGSPRVYPDYKDCWIEIRGKGGEYEITFRKDGGQAVSNRFALDPEAFALQRLFNGEIKPKAYGEKLFLQVLNGPEIYHAFSTFREDVDRLNKGMRIRLSIDDANLSNLAWELLFDPNPQVENYICLYKKSPIVRYNPLWANVRRASNKISGKPALKILGLAVSPQDMAPLDIKKEQQLIERVLKEPIRKGKVLLEWSTAHSWEEFQREIRTGEWNVLHFIGHSKIDKNQGGVIYLQWPDGKRQSVTAENFAMPICDSTSLNLVVLNSCFGATSAQGNSFSSLAATLVRRGIPAVVAMQGKIIDENAALLAYKFYEAQVDGLPIEAALSEARQNLKQAFSEEDFYWALPVLFMRSDDGKLFDFSG